MSKIHSSMPHNNGNVIAAVDFETTGTRAGYHEPIQIAIVPLNSDLRPIPGIVPFYHEIRPYFPERADPLATRVHGLDLDRLAVEAPEPGDVEVLLIEWWNRLELPFERRLIPLAHNWPFELSFFRAWLGTALTEALFTALPRDSMTYALGLNDKCFFRGQKALFPYVGLGDLCNHFGVVNTKPHDSLADSIAEAEVYRHLLQVDVL
jgi:DNA polymerase III epsilon subunit-like protein